MKFASKKGDFATSLGEKKNIMSNKDKRRSIPMAYEEGGYKK